MINQSMRQNWSVSPPRAHQSPVVVGESMVLATSTTASALDLGSAPVPSPPTSGGSAQSSQLQGAVGHYITVFADTADVGLIFGPSLASVTAGNAPALASNGSVTSGVYTPGTGTCHRIPAGQERRFQLLMGQDRFMGFVGSAAGQMRVYQSSPSGV